MRAVRHFKLDERGQRTMRFVCGLDGIALAEGVTRKTVTITRTGEFTDPRYGRFAITREMLLSMVRNFNARTYGQDISIDVAHEPEKGAAARVLSLAVDGNRLRAEVEFTPYGVDAVKGKGFRYLSAEFVDDYIDNEQGKSHGPTLLGAGLTTRPVIKRLDPVELAESPSNTPVFLHPELIRQLSESLEQYTMNKREKLRAKLVARKLSEKQINAILASYDAAAKTLGEDDKAHDTLIDQLDDAAKQLAESGTTDQPVQITIAAPAAGKMLSEEDVRKLLTEDREKTASDARKLAETKTARVKTFTDTIDAAKGLSDDTRTTLKKAGDLITADMSEDQARRLAESQLALGEQLESSRQLSALGFNRAGSPHITLDETNGIKKLAESVRKGIASTESAEKLTIVDPEKQSPFVKKLLAQFDVANAERLHAESKMLSAGGVTNISDSSLPASFTREVILQTYQDFAILSLVNANVDPTNSATHTIPYELRNTAGVTNGGRTYEGQPIQRAGVQQLNDFAYIFPRKLALEVSNEVLYFSRQNGNINWDAWGRNLVSNAALMRELVVTDIANRMQRDADSYGAVSVTAEAAVASTVASNAYKLTHFPLIRPLQEYDLQGNAIGAVKQPFVPHDGATALIEYNGTGTQPAGKYYKVLSWNLGLVQLVTQAGAPTAPAGALTFDYWYATNVIAVDTDIAAGSTYRRQMNEIIQGVGNRKAALASSPRFTKADFGVMSEVLNNMASDAEVFSANFQRADTSITSAGDLNPIKNIPMFSTNAPSIDLGDERVLLGQKKNFWYTIAKPYAVGDMVERVDNNGQFIGKKGAYGEEYASMTIPLPLRGYFTSLLAYSHTNARG